MITEQDLKDAIAECQGQRNPNANTCIKLAAFLTIQRELFGGGRDALPSLPETDYSFSDGTIGAYGDSDFLKAIANKNAADVWPIMDELMDTMQVLQPRIYDSVMRRLDRL